MSNERVTPSKPVTKHEVYTEAVLSYDPINNRLDIIHPYFLMSITNPTEMIKGRGKRMVGLHFPKSSELETSLMINEEEIDQQFNLGTISTYEFTPKEVKRILSLKGRSKKRGALVSYHVAKEICEELGLGEQEEYSDEYAENISEEDYETNGLPDEDAFWDEDEEFRDDDDDDEFD